MSSKTQRSTRASTSKKAANGVSDETRESSVFSNVSLNSTTATNKGTRTHEKEQLSGLNNRLAAYIEKVRSLEAENAALNVQIQRIESEDVRKATDNTDAYVKKIEDLRALLDKLSHDKNLLEIERNKAVHEGNDATSRLVRIERELKSTSSALLSEQNLTQELKASVETHKNRTLHAEKERNRLSDELKDLMNKLKLAKKALEDETILRSDLQNRILTLTEELEFERLANRRNVEEFHTKKSQELTVLRSELDKSFNAELVEQLHAMRAECDQKIAQSRKETDAMYQKKFRDAASSGGKDKAELTNARVQISTLRGELSDVNAKYRNLTGQQDNLQGRINELEGRLKGMESDYSIRLNDKDEHIKELEEQIETLMVQYSDLMDVKVQLDTEINAYRRLLEGEETRLNISADLVNSTNLSEASPSRNSSFIRKFLSTGRPAKRPRLEDSFREELELDPSLKQKVSQMRSVAKSHCVITIEDFPECGSYVKLRNNSDEPFVLGKWKLEMESDSDAIAYIFNPKFTIPANGEIKIWSKNALDAETGNSNLKFKNQNWPTGEALKSVLYDPSDNVKATRDLYSEADVVKHIKTGKSDENCSIM